MQDCPFEKDLQHPCPVIEDYKSVLFESCSRESYGRNCAAIVAQLAVLGTTGQEGVRSSLDELFGEITGHYFPDVITASDAPAEVQADVLKCRYPIRENRPFVESGVAIHHFDLVCTLLNNELLAAANWYEDRRSALSNSTTTYDWWIFAETDGEISDLLSPKNTIAEYDQSFRKGSSVFGNATTPLYW